MASTLRGIHRTKAVYLALFLGLFVLTSTLLSRVFMGLAQQVDDAERARALAASSAASVFRSWGLCSWLLGLFLGASVLSAEMRAKTIVSILARPIERWAFLVGKWLGVQVFLAAFAAVGVLLGLGVVSFYGLHPQALLWIGVLESLVRVALVSSLAFLFSTVTSPVVAGGTTMLLFSLPRMTEQLLDHPSLLVRLPVGLLYFAAPAAQREDFIGQSLSQSPLDPHYGLFAAVLCENTLYMLAALVGACLVFTRREIRVG